MYTFQFHHLTVDNDHKLKKKIESFETNINVFMYFEKLIN